VPTAFSTTSGCDPIAGRLDLVDSLPDALSESDEPDGPSEPDGPTESDPPPLDAVPDDGGTVRVVVMVGDASAAALFLGLRSARNATTSTAMPSTATRIPARRSLRWRRAT
jgi:hypothetical protein